MTSSIRAPEPPLAVLARRADLTLRERGRIRRRAAERLSPSQLEALGRIGRAAAAAGQSVFLVGGAVRDLLLRRPIRDIDVAVQGDARALAARLPGVARTHPAFGTATVEPRSGVRIDLSTTRTEFYRRPGSLPEVQRASLAEDLARRDFTINALAVPFDQEGANGLVDPFGGLADLRARRVRVLHAQSFLDDPTRLFRAVHLAAVLNFRIERENSRLMRAGAAGIELLSAARLRREVERTLGSAHADRAVRLLAEYALPGRIAAGWLLPRDAARQVARLRGVRAWFDRRCPGEAVASWTVVLILLLRDSPGPRVREALTRLALDRATREAVLDGVAALCDLPRALAQVREPSRIHALCAGHATEGLLALLAATATGPAAPRVRRYLTVLRNVRADVDGRDLLRGGVPPGPAVARGLRAALAAKLDGRAPGRAAQLREALAAARRP